MTSYSEQAFTSGLSSVFVLFHTNRNVIEFLAYPACRLYQGEAFNSFDITVKTI